MQNSPVDMSSIITNADAIDDDVKKIETLKQAIIDLKNAKEAASNTGSLLSGMMDKQDGFFSEPVKDNYEDMVINPHFFTFFLGKYFVFVVFRHSHFCTVSECIGRYVDIFIILFLP